MIYLIGGTPRSGKSMLAKMVAKKLRISWLPADIIEGLPKMNVPKKDYNAMFPKEIMRRETNYSNDQMYAKYSAAAIVKAYGTQADSVWLGIERLIDAAIRDKHDLIIEGYQLPVKQVARMIKENPKQIKALYLYKKGTENILKGLFQNKDENDWIHVHTSNAQTYPAIAKSLDLYGSKIAKEATGKKLRSFNTADNFRATLKQALNYLTR